MSDHVVAAAAEIPPGTHRVVKIRNSEIGVFNVGGVFHALPNLCPHQFGPLCAGTTAGTPVMNAKTGWRWTWAREGEILTCPWHGLEFDILTGACLANPRLKVRRYPVRVDDGQVVITLPGGG